MHDSVPHDREAKKHRRAGRACLNCRARKVKCNVVESDPCSNCRWDKTRCEVPRNRRTRKFVFAPDRDESEKQSTTTASGHVSHAYTPASPHNQSRPTGPIASALATPNNSPEETKELPCFIASHPPEFDTVYLSFLHTQRALALPPLLLQAALVKCYVEDCYGRMPLLDLEHFCDVLASEDGSNGHLSLLLYQAVLLAGAVHIAPSVLRDAGYPDGKAFRKDVCRRIEFLFDSNMEKDPLVLIQTALLVGYSGMSYTDRKDSWYWVNTAITLAYSIDLHRDPAKRGLPIRRERLLRRLWWCCHVRDKVLSKGLHKPARIRARDYHVHMLDISDMECNVLTRQRSLIGGCIIAGGFQLSQQIESAELCIEKTKLSVLIGHVLEIESQAARAAPGTNALFLDAWSCRAVDVEAANAALESWYYSLPESCRCRPLSLQRSGNHRDSNMMMKSVSSRRHLLHMAYHSIVFLLHRPRIIPGINSSDSHCPDNHIPSVTTGGGGMSGKLVLDSAKHITRLAAELHDQDYDSDLPVGALFALSPAICTNLVNINNPSSAVSQLAMFGLRVCIRLLWRLRELYPAPDATIQQLETMLKVGNHQRQAEIKSIAHLVQLNNIDQTDISAVLGKPSPWVPMAIPSETLAEQPINNNSYGVAVDDDGYRRAGTDELLPYAHTDSHYNTPTSGSNQELLNSDLSNWLRAEDLVLPIDGTTIPLLFS